MRDVVTKQTRLLEMLIEVYERTQGNKDLKTQFQKEHVLSIHLSDLKNYGFKYDGGEDMRFYEVYQTLLSHDSGLIDFQQNDPDQLQWEYNSGGSDQRSIITPAYKITVTKTFRKEAQNCLHSLQVNSQVSANQIVIGWNSELFEIYRITPDSEKKSYKIKAGRGAVDKRRTIVSSLITSPTHEIKVDSLRKKTSLLKKDLVKEIGRINETIQDSLDVKGRDLIILDTDQSFAKLNQKDFFIDV